MPAINGLHTRSRSSGMPGTAYAFEEGSGFASRIRLWRRPLALEKRFQAPPDRLRPRHALICSLTGGNRNDITEMIPLADAIPSAAWPQAVRRSGLPLTRGPAGAPSARHPAEDRLAESARNPLALGKRWVVERTIAWLHQYRRLRIRYERRDDITRRSARSAAARLLQAPRKPRSHSVGCSKAAGGMFWLRCKTLSGS